MQVQMENGLSGIATDVIDRAKAMLQIAFTRYFCRHGLAVANKLGILFCRLVNADDVLLRNNQNMGWGLRIDVLKGEGLLVFIHLPRRNPAGDDFAEKAISHSRQMLAKPATGLGKDLIQPDQIDSRVRVQLVDHFLGAFFVIFRHAHTHPVPAHGAAELQDSGRVIAVSKLLF